MSGTSACKGSPREPSLPAQQVGTQCGGPGYDQEEALTWQYWHLALGLPRLQSCRK